MSCLRFVLPKPKREEGKKCRLLKQKKHRLLTRKILDSPIGGEVLFFSSYGTRIRYFFPSWFSMRKQQEAAACVFQEERVNSGTTKNKSVLPTPRRTREQHRAVSDGEERVSQAAVL